MKKIITKNQIRTLVIFPPKMITDIPPKLTYIQIIDIDYAIGDIIILKVKILDDNSFFRLYIRTEDINATQYIKVNFNVIMTYDDPPSIKKTIYQKMYNNIQNLKPICTYKKTYTDFFNKLKYNPLTINDIHAQ